MMPNPQSQHPHDTCGPCAAWCCMGGSPLGDWIIVLSRLASRMCQCLRVAASFHTSLLELQSIATAASALMDSFSLGYFRPSILLFPQNRWALTGYSRSGVTQNRCD